MNRLSPATGKHSFPSPSAATPTGWTAAPTASRTMSIIHATHSVNCCSHWATPHCRPPLRKTNCTCPPTGKNRSCRFSSTTFCRCPDWKHTTSACIFIRNMKRNRFACHGKARTMKTTYSSTCPDTASPSHRADTSFWSYMPTTRTMPRAATRWADTCASPSPCSNPDETCPIPTSCRERYDRKTAHRNDRE